MLVGDAAGHGQVHTSPQGKGGAVTPAPTQPPGAVVSVEAAPFLNPAVNFDYQSGIAVIEIRDGETGEVKVQYPSKKVVEEYQRHGGEAQDAAPVESPAPVAAEAAPPSAAAQPAGPAAPQSAAPVPPPPAASSGATDQVA